jgi:hypothetical protein
MERTSKRQVQVAVARKLAVTMIAIWKSGERYDPHHMASGTNLSKAADSVL